MTDPSAIQATPQVALADADSLAAAVDGQLGNVVNELAVAVTTSGQQSADALAGVKKTLTGALKSVAAIADPALSSVVDTVTQTLAAQSSVSAAQADQLVSSLASVYPAAAATATVAAAAGVPAGATATIPAAAGVQASANSAASNPICSALQWALVKPLSGTCYILAPGIPVHSPSDQCVSAYDTQEAALAALHDPVGVAGCAGASTAAPAAAVSGAWYCVINTATGCGVTTVPADASGGPPANLTPGYSVIGPYPDSATASAVCQAACPPSGPTTPPTNPAGPTHPAPGPTNPVPPTCPAPPPCPVAPPPPPPPSNPCGIHCTPFTSPLQDMQSTATYRIGDDNWCIAMEALKDQLSLLGKGILSKIQSLQPKFGNYDCNPQWIQDATVHLPFGLDCLVQKLYAANINVGNQFTGWFSTIFNASYSIMVATTCDNPTLTISLVFVRSILQALKRFRIGTDLGLWATIDISVQWDQAEAAVDYLIKSSCPYLIPSAGETLDAYIKGRISFEKYRCWLNMNGHDETVWQPVLEARRTFLGPEELFRLFHRNRPGVVASAAEFTEDYLREALTHTGYDGTYQDRLFALRYVPYTLREIRQLLDAEKATRDDVYAAFRDMGYDDAKANAQADMELVLTARRRAAEVHGDTPQQIILLYGAGIIDHDTVRSRMTLLGYSYDDSVQLITSADETKRAKLADQWQKKAVSDFTTLLEANYKQGLASAATVQAGLMQLGSSAASAASIISTWTGEVELLTRKATIAAVKKAWLVGQLNETTAILDLAGAGMDGTAALLLLAQWQAEQGIDGKTLSAGEVLRMVGEGLLPPADAAVRLRNLGWEMTDADLLLAEAKRKLEKAQATAEAAAAKAEETAAAKESATQAKHAALLTRQEAAAAKAAAAAIKAAQLVVTKGQDALRKLTPVSKLLKWLKTGLIGEDLFRQRMLDMGEPSQLITAYLQELTDATGQQPTATGEITDIGGPPNEGQ